LLTSDGLGVETAAAVLADRAGAEVMQARERAV
jgi:hypothetical protein